MLAVLCTATLATAATPLEVHGHRGAMAVRPENTMAAFEEGIRAGADFLELDVLTTKDGVLVVHHDPHINIDNCRGGSGKKAIRELTLAEVKEYDCGSATAKAFPRQVAAPGAAIPTLDEVLTLANSSKIRFNIEIKSSEKWQNLQLPPDEIARAVVEAVRNHNLESRAMIQSFDFRVVKAVRAFAPDIAAAALYSGADREFTDIAQETGVKLVTPQYKVVTPEKVKAAHAAGVRVIPWTVDTPEEWDRLIDAGVDGIITNDPGGLAGHLRKKGLR